MRLYDDTGPPIYVEGYASIFDVAYDVGGGIMERVEQGAFDLRHPAFATFDHDHNRCFARTDDGSLQLWQDKTGLAFQFTLPSTWTGLSLARQISNNTFRNCSVYFTERRVSHRREGALAVDLVHGARINEISICCSGGAANNSTSVWLDSEDPIDMPGWIATARARWRAGRMQIRVTANRAKARARAAAGPPPELLAQIDRILAMPWPAQGRRR